jgi:hypothetical protein
MSLRCAGWALAALWALAPSAWAQEAAITKRATQLRETPGDAGRSLAQLAAQSPVTRTPERQGPWVQVRTPAGVSGWVHLFDLAPATGSAATADASGGGSGVMRGVTGMLGRGMSPSSSTSASGIRGLGAEDIAKATPNPAAVGQMEALRQSEADARSFAQSAPWTPADVPLPAAPAARPGSGGGDPSRSQ